MEILTRNASVRDRVRIWRETGKTSALVPTTGALHKGHMSLIAGAQERADHVVVSICGNSAETGAATQSADRELLVKMGTDVLFAPPMQEIYPVGYELSASVNIPRFAHVVAGADRSAYVGDIITVMLKLFNIVKPDYAVFGERDFLQLASVRQMVMDLFVPLEVVAMAAFRETDGLALDRSNRLLTAEQRAVAPQLYSILRQVARKIDAGDRGYESLERQGLESLAADGFKPEYFAIRQAADLAPVRAATRDVVILAAANLGDARLTDHLRVRLIDRF
jgi:pantoate--beta-alanine ligase